LPLRAGLERHFYHQQKKNPSTGGVLLSIVTDPRSLVCNRNLLWVTILPAEQQQDNREFSAEYQQNIRELAKIAATLSRR
jgi:hypothetical protein